MPYHSTTHGFVDDQLQCGPHPFYLFVSRIVSSPNGAQFTVTLSATWLSACFYKHQSRPDPAACPAAGFTVRLIPQLQGRWPGPTGMLSKSLQSHPHVQMSWHAFPRVAVPFPDGEWLEVADYSAVFAGYGALFIWCEFWWPWGLALVCLVSCVTPWMGYDGLWRYHMFPVMQSGIVLCYKVLYEIRLCLCSELNKLMVNSIYIIWYMNFTHFYYA